MSEFSITDFVRESLRIEGIHREPTEVEISATLNFIGLNRITVMSLEDLVKVYAPGHKLRELSTQNVRVGNHIPPPGGAAVMEPLRALLAQIKGGAISPWAAHCEYERIHPFTDGNGRSGRAVWLWMMDGRAPIGFLHRFYYQTLDARASTP